LRIKFAYSRIKAKLKIIKIQLKQNWHLTAKPAKKIRKERNFLWLTFN